MSKTKQPSPAKSQRKIPASKKNGRWNAGRPTRFPGKPSPSRLTVSLTPACRKRIKQLAKKMDCSESDTVEFSIWQLEAN